MQNKSSASYSMLIGSMLIFGTIGVLRRYIPLSSAFLSMLRGFIGVAFITLFCIITKKGIFSKLDTKNLLLLVITGAAIGFNWMLLFESYNYTTVANATLSYYMQPTIVILLSPLLLKEKLTAKKGVCAVLAVIGMVLISGVTESAKAENSDIKGILFGLFAAVLYSFVVIINKLITAENAYQKTVIQLSAAAVVLLPYVLLTENIFDVKFNAVSIILIISLGIVHTGIAYTLYFASIGKLKAQSIAILSYIDPVFALILSATVLKESITVTGIIGAVLIIGSALASELNLKKSI